MAFIGIEPPPDIIKLLPEIQVPGIKCDSSTYHITLVHFKLEADNISKLIEYIEPIFEISNTFKPFEISISSIGNFDAEEKIPIIALVQSPELIKIQKELSDKLDNKKLDYSKNFKVFKPHLTLSFSDKKEGSNFELELPSILKWQAQNIFLYGGKKEKQTIKFSFPLNFEVEDYTKLANLGSIYQQLSKFS